MTHDDEQRIARELLESVAADAMKDAPACNTPLELCEMIVARLRDESDLMDELRDGNKHALALIELHDLGAQPDTTAHAGVVGIRFLCFTQQPPTELLGTMTNTDETALALMTYQTADDGDTALIMLAAKDPAALFFAVGQTNGDRFTHATAFDGDELRAKTADAPHTAALMLALLAAAGRRAQ